MLDSMSIESSELISSSLRPELGFVFAGLVLAGFDRE